MESHEFIHGKNRWNKYFKNQSLEPLCLLSVELAVQYRVHDATRGNDQEKNVLQFYGLYQITYLHEF